ncbi:MAG: hypothetical protein H5U40_15790 [Polyangiaceae bacterium]|nr:hypothetical protein [Polyangiaceae bacterium]
MISMEDIELTAPKIEGDSVIVNVGVLATTYRQPQPAAPAEGQGS